MKTRTENQFFTARAARAGAAEILEAAEKLAALIHEHGWGGIDVTTNRTYRWAVTHTDAGDDGHREHEISVGAVLGLLEEVMRDEVERNRLAELAAWSTGNTAV